MIFRRCASVGVLCAVMLAAAPAIAQESDAEAKALANANNPLANIVALNIQNYYYASLYGTDDTANTAWLRYAQPFGRWLMRASMTSTPALSSRSWMSCSSCSQTSAVLPRSDSSWSSLS